jgi:hypothetical protein
MIKVKELTVSDVVSIVIRHMHYLELNDVLTIVTQLSKYADERVKREDANRTKRP